MGYSKSQKAIEGVRVYLVEIRRFLSQPDKSIISFQCDEPIKLQYKLREALTAAHEHKVEPFHELKDKIRIRIQANNIIVERKSASLYDIRMSETPVLLTTAIHDRVETIHGAVEATILSPNEVELNFPQLVCDEEELRKLHNWTSQTGYSIILNPDSGIKLIKGKREDQWKPQLEKEEST